MVSALSRQGVCWGRGIRPVDFVMSNGEERFLRLYSS